MSKLKPKIKHSIFNSSFIYSEDGNEVKELEFNLTLKLAGIKANGSDKFRIIQELKEAVDNVKAKYE